MQAVGTGEANGLLLISRSEKQVHFSSSLDLQYSRGNAFITRTYPPNDQVQLRVDPLHGDLDEEVHGLHGKVVQLKQLAQHIESETKFQNELLNQLEATVAKAQAGLKSTMRRLNRNLAQRGLSPVVIVVLFALFCFFCVFLWSKFQRRR